MLSPEWKKRSPDTLTSELGLTYLPQFPMIYIAELIKRLRALTLRLLPHEVDVKIISAPTSRIITPLVMLSYMEAAGDFGDAVGTFLTPRTRE